jgi:hypothetical protein
MIVNSRPQNQTPMIIAVKVKVEHIYKAILLHSNNGSGSCTVALGIGFTISTGQPSRIGLHVIIASEKVGGVEGVECLQRDRGRHVFEVVFDRHVFDVSRDARGEPLFAALEVGVGCVGQGISWESRTFEKVVCWCCESGYNRKQSESGGNEG